MSFTTDTITPFTDGRAWAVVEGSPCPGSRTACPRFSRAMCRYGGNPHPPAAIMQLDKECEYCGGTSGPDWNVPVCPVCNGNGRHTFDVTVPCPDCLPDQPGWVLSGGNEKKLPDGRWVWFCSCRDRERPFDEPFGTVTKRVSIVPGTVLPIRADLLADWLDMFVSMEDGNPLLVRGDDVEPISLPPAAKPGMYAARLQKEVR
jgi:hypothetical protein